jgi:hypothetical protein
MGGLWLEFLKPPTPARPLLSVPTMSQLGTQRAS